MSFNKWMGKQTIVQPDSRVFSVIKKKKKWANELLKDVEESQMYIAKWETPDWESYLSMTPIIWLSEEGKTIERVKRSVVAKGWGVHEEGTTRSSREDLQGSETSLCDTAMVGTWHVLVTTHRILQH